MHDPKVGRFFAVDPLEKKYPWNSPYAFSENRVIASVELEGLEDTGYTNMLDRKLGSKAWLNMSTEQRIREAKEQSIGMVVGIAVAADVYFNQGKVTTFLAKQLGTQLAVNATVSGIVWVLPGSNKFSPSTVIEETFTGFDLADAGIDKGIEVVLDKYKIGKIQKAIKIIAPSLFDITIKDGFQVVGINKKAENIITDIIGNYLVDGLEKKLGKLPTGKLSSASQAQVLGKIIMDEIKSVMSEDGTKINISKIKVKDQIEKQNIEDREVKNDAISKNKTPDNYEKG